MTETELHLYLNQKLVEIADAMLTYYDACGIQGNACKGGDPNPCCVNTIFGKGVCPFWHGGCQFRNASCKLWLCKTAIATTDPKCVEGLKLLSQFGELYGIVRRPLIGHPYVGADKQREGTVIPLIMPD